MTDPEDIAREHYDARAALSRAAQDYAARLWAQVDPADVAASWLAQVPALDAAITAAQYQAAGAADDYVTGALAAQDLDPAGVARVDPGAFAGLASDARALDTLLVQPALTTLSALSAGYDRGRAMATGQAALRMIATTQVADAGRVADGVALVARRAATGYVRVLVPPSCARCAILAGRRYRWSAGFQRHPHCDCVHLPTASAYGRDLTTNPRAYFVSLSPAEQDRIFGLAGARAIRDGADMNQVVNARRGMYVAGGRKLTREGTTRRGLFGGYQIDGNGRLTRRTDAGLERRAGQRVRSARQARLTPEEIYRQAGDDRDEAIRLLREHGYLRADARTAISPTPTPRVKPTPAVPAKAARYHRGLGGIESLGASVRRVGPDATRVRLSGGVSATTEMVTLRDGTKLVAKRGMDWGSPAEVAESIRGQADAEQLASLLGRAIGAPVVRVYRQSRDQVWMPWIDGRVIGELSRTEVLDLVRGRDGQLLGLLDHLVANADRNSGNIMVTADGRLVGIDHGWAWTRDHIRGAGPTIQDRADTPAGHYSRDRAWRDNPLTLGDVARLRQRLQALRPDFELVGRGAWLDYSLRQLDELALHARGTVDLID